MHPYALQHILTISNTITMPKPNKVVLFIMQFQTTTTKQQEILETQSGLEAQVQGGVTGHLPSLRE